MAYRIAITYTQETGDTVDHRTLSEDFSENFIFHEAKCQVFTEELTEASKRISNRLTAMAIEAAGGYESAVSAEIDRKKPKQ